VSVVLTFLPLPIFQRSLPLLNLFYRSKSLYTARTFTDCCFLEQIIFPNDFALQSSSPEPPPLDPEPLDHIYGSYICLSIQQPSTILFPHSRYPQAPLTSPHLIELTFSPDLDSNSLTLFVVNLSSFTASNVNGTLILFSSLIHHSSGPTTCGIRHV
jgi:hypothetical protein